MSIKMNTIIIYCVVLLSLHRCRAAPPPQTECLFQGCKCTKNSDESYDILCIANDAETVFPLRSINEAFNTSITINTFLIKRFKFRQIPDGAFADLDVRNLIVGENQLETLTVNAFRDMKSLTLLRIIEKNFNRIEPGALDWVKDTLTELGLWQLDFKHKEIDLFFIQLARLDRLKSLNLMGYYLTEFKADWTRMFTNLTTLSLASNDMRRMSPTIFENAKHLQSLDLSNNFLSNLTNLFDALKPIRSHLRELKLYGNSIENLLDFPEIDNLQMLDLSNNKIKVIHLSTFQRLKKLSNLYISNNLLNKIDSNAFENLTHLTILLLNNNYLTQTPSIVNLGRLKILDLSNQNGHMRVIHDYAFDRIGVETSSNKSNSSSSSSTNITQAVSINLDLNDIERFGDKSFCSRSTQAPYNDISNIDLAYATVKRLDKCIFKQVRSSLAPRVSLNIGLYLHSLNESSQVCNCEFKAFIREFKIDLIGGCSLLAKPCQYPNSDSSTTNLTSACLDKRQFDCQSTILN